VTPAALERWGPQVEKALDRVLPKAGRQPKRLHEAMRYSVLAGGKRLRPVLALVAYEACGGRDADSVLPAAAALELFHTYSLIHDDLPAMDDDDLRRGKPTCHVVYGQGMAILAGDALQTLGAYLLCSEPKGSKWLARRNRAAREVLAALGSEGMAGGQAMDLLQTGSGGTVSPKDLTTLHNLKTGRFLQAAVLAGAHWAGASAAQRKALATYGASIGLAFQIVDDILDETESAEALGKTPGKDASQGKATFPALWGLEESRREVERLLSDALRAAAQFEPRGRDLREIAHFVTNRHA
jgi:geranylgeranyl diphosphate synthase, type II